MDTVKIRKQDVLHDESIEQRIRVLNVDAFVVYCKKNNSFGESEKNPSEPEIGVDGSTEPKPIEIDQPLDRNLFKSLARLALRLETKLVGYDTVIVDDVGGRLIALFLHRIINIKRSEAGLAPSQTLFIAGGRGDHSIRAEKIKEFLKEKKKKIVKALLVTEHMRSGLGINWIVEIMDGLHIDFDLATLSIEKLPDFYNKFSGIANRLYYGSLGTEGYFFWDRKKLTGVRKNKNDKEIIESGGVITAHATLLNSNELDIELMNKSREAMYLWADKICNKLLK